MLKIKDEVDLKELKKFGFDFKENKQKEPYYSAVGLFIWCKNRLIQCNYIYDQTIGAYNILFDLIQAGLVEKVADNE